MGNSHHLRLRDLRAIYLLLGECCELGADPLVWRSHMLRRLSRVLGSQVAICGALRPPNGEAAMQLLPKSFIDVGWATDRDRKFFLQWLEEFPPGIDPLVRHMADTVPRAQASLTCARRDVITDNVWYNSAFYHDFYRTSSLDDRIESFFWHARSQTIDGICLIRPHDASPFDGRGRKLLRLFHREICRLLGTKLADTTGPSVASLSTRLRQVLACLLEGNSEKQVATRLGISRHTVHEYVKRLHRHFGVASRGELLSRCCRFLPVMQTLDKSEDSTPDRNAAARAFGDAFRMR